MQQTVTRVRIPTSDRELEGELVLPEKAQGAVIIAQGTLHDPDSLARALNQRGLATLSIAVLSEAEADSPLTRFNVDLLTDRLFEVSRWLAGKSRAAGLAQGFLVSDTATAGALAVAVEVDFRVKAVVSLSGRVDLAERTLAQVQAPTLFIAGERDEAVVQRSREASRRMACRRDLLVVPRAGTRFEEPGAREQVAKAAADWFARHLA